ncbi:MAG TPA: phage holin family protein [Blastocatellia bacterium]|nr:phage holin family protein [Blastocatellia bacterium]
MGDTEKGKSAGTQARSDDESLPQLIGRLGEDLTSLIDTKLSLLKIEIKEDVDAYTRHGVTMAIAGVIAVVGFALLNVAIAFLVSTLFEGTELSQPVRYALGFIITASAYLIAGGVMIARTKNRLAKQDLVPNRSVKELERDKEWIEKEL